MTKKALRKYQRDYYREKRRNDGGEYAAYMAEYMRNYRASNPDYVKHEREYNKIYARRKRLEKIREGR